MSDNLPELNFKEKKEKKRGALGWLRDKLGFGSRGAMGEASSLEGGQGLNLGKAAFGASKFGTSSGLAGLLAGKAGIIATIAMVAAAGGLYVTRNSPSPMAGSSDAFKSNVASSSDYVPAILRSQAANQGSSLDLFEKTNKGALAQDMPAKSAKANDTAASASSKPDQGNDQNAPAPDQQNMAQSMLPKLQGGNMASLTSQLGGGSNNFSNFGGFGNKFNDGATGMKMGFTSGIGSGFAAMPKFDSRKQKLLAMKGSARPVFGGARAGRNGAIGAGAWNQAQGLRGIQKSYTGTSIDAARSTQDQAWTGTTADGSTAGGAGISDGGAGVVSGPSLDNNNGLSGSGGASGTGDNVPDSSGSTDVSPWASELTTIMTLVLVSCVLSVVASKIANMGPWGKIIAIVLAVIAALLAAAAIVMAIKLMGSQKLLGGLYMIGGLMALASAIMAISGATKGAESPTTTWLAMGAGVLGLIGSMLGGK